MKEKRQRAVLLIDDIANHEGVLSTLRSSGRYFRTARLAELDAWHDVNDLFDRFEISAVVAKFSVTALLHIGSFGRRPDADQLIRRIAPLPHVVFMSEGLFSGAAMDKAARDAAVVFDRESTLNVQEVTIGSTTIRPGEIDRLRIGIHRVKESDLRVVVSATDAEITVAAEQFLHEAERGLLFRAYVPSGRLWESEFDRMIGLFKDFLVRVANVEVRLEQTRTTWGVSYAFYGEGISPQRVATDFDDFTNLLNISATDPAAAEAVLSNRYSLPAKEVAAIVTKWAKEARRLHVDVTQDRERKLLNIRHGFQSELYESVPELDMRTVEKIIEAVVPESLALVPTQRGPLSINVFQQPQISFRFTEQHIERLDGIVAREIYGDVQLSVVEKQFIDTITTYGASEVRELTTALYELRDPGVPDAERVSAGQRLRTFLLSIAENVSGVAFGVLQSYIEKKLGL